MKLPKRLALILLGCSACFGALAAVVANLYQAQVPVASYSETDRSQAIRQAFSQVLQRISAPGEGADKLLAQADKHAETLLQTYQYQKSDTEPKLLLQISFPTRATRQLLRQYQVPLWGQQRPRILLWTAYRDQGRQLLSDMDDNALHSAIEQSAAARGLPIALPLMDLTDSQQVFYSDVSGQFVKTLAQASERYRPDGFAGLHIFQRGGQWQGKWVMQEGGEQARGEVRSESPEQVAAALVEQLADHLASQYAVRLDGAEASQLLMVGDLGTLEDLVLARRILEGLAMINRAELVQLDQNQATLALQISGELEDVRRALAFDRHFRLTNDHDQGEELILNYQWNP